MPLGWDIPGYRPSLAMVGSRGKAGAASATEPAPSSSPHCPRAKGCDCRLLESPCGGTAGSLGLKIPGSQPCHQLCGFSDTAFTISYRSPQERRTKTVLQRNTRSRHTLCAGLSSHPHRDHRRGCVLTPMLQRRRLRHRKCKSLPTVTPLAVGKPECNPRQAGSGVHTISQKDPNPRAKK